MSLAEIPLFSINTHLRSMDSKAMAHPNGNIYIGGEASWVDWQTMQKYKHFGVFSYNNNFDPCKVFILHIRIPTANLLGSKQWALVWMGAFTLPQIISFMESFSGALTYLYLPSLMLTSIWFGKYIGGDRYYSTYGVKATSDMGVIVSGYGYDLNFPETGGLPGLWNIIRMGLLGLKTR